MSDPQSPSGPPPEPRTALNVPRWLPGEQEAVALVKRLGAEYGYGNLIGRLRDAWSAHMQTAWGHSKEAGDRAAGHICVWCSTDHRTGKKGK